MFRIPRLPPCRTIASIAACALLALHSALGIHALRQHNVTVDEGGHILSGLLTWRQGDLAYYRVNPPFLKLLLALPLLPAELQLPDRAGLGPTDSWCEYFDRFAAANADCYQDMVWLSRYVAVILSAVGGWIVYCWSRQLFGSTAGLVAISLWVSCPNVLAWSGVATVDLGATVFGLAAAYSLRRYLARLDWLAALCAGVLLGLAVASKFTLLVLYPVTVVVCAATAWHRRGSRAFPGTLASGMHLGFILAISLLVINLCYGFRGTGRVLGEFEFRCHALTQPNAILRVNRFRETWLAFLPVPLPDDFVRGLDQQQSYADCSLPTYMRGQWQYGGWWYYYIYALAVKLPLGSLLLAVLSLLLPCWGAHYRLASVEGLVLWLPPAALLALLSCETGINIGLRYLLPAFPFFFVGISRVGILFDEAWRFWRQGRPVWPALGGILVISSLALNGTEVARIHPHYIAYFNQVAGGPEGGWRHLIDANIDWGQDLLFLRDWLGTHPEAQPLRLAYFGGIDPHLIGLNYRFAPFGPDPDEFFPDPALPREMMGPRPGWYAVSVNFVCGMGFRGHDEQSRAVCVPSGAYRYFRCFSPVDRAGHSILIYHITSPEVDVMRRHLGLPLLRR